MTSLRLILRNLLYFRAASLAVIVGTIVASAVLTGALMVGDSVRGSLRDLAVQRLGPTDYSLAGGRFFTASLAQRIATDKGLNGRYELAPAVIVTGGASIEQGADQNHPRTRAGDVQIAAAGGSWAPVDPGACILNGETADALSVTGSAPVLFTFPSMQDTPRDAAVARRDVTDAVAQLPVQKSTVVRQPGMLSLFSLYGGQRVPRNAWLNLGELQQAVSQPERANVLLVHDKQAGAGADPAASVTDLNKALQEVASLDDYGLSVTPAGTMGEGALLAKGTYLSPGAVAAAERVASEMKISPQLVTVNLVNQVIRAPDGGANGQQTVLHYCIAAGISSIEGKPLGANELVLNEATARQLDAHEGDTIRLLYYQRGPGGELHEVSSAADGFNFRVSRILPMPDRPGGSIAADPSLTPQYKGLTDAASVGDWDPPRELNINEKIAEKDQDAYWRKYKASPRLFVSIDAARKMWGGPYGDLTSIRIPADKAGEFSARLRNAIDPAQMGMSFRAVKAQQIAAASSGTDFSELFVSFSFFVIVAAALLVAMLFRLSIEQRARQLGVLSSIGFGPRRLRRLALGEGMILAVIGSAIGLAGAIVYTWLLIYGLRTWWVGAVGTTALRLYIAPMTLLYGFFSAIIVAFIAIWWSVWRVGRVAPARLLAGAWGYGTVRVKRTGRAVRWIGIIIFAIGLLLLIAVLVRIVPQPETALGAGALLLCGGLCWLAGILRPHRHRAALAGMSSVEALGMRNASVHTGRSVLSIGLIAFAAFTLIIVASMRRQSVDDTGDKTSGAGGYRLIVQAGVPLLGDLDTLQGRDLLGVRDPKNPLWSEAHFTLLRRWAGQDISCLNLTRPSSPTILGVPDSMIQRGGFTFASQTAKADNPWTLIQAAPSGPDNQIIPVIADDETAQYILHLSPGDVMSITDQTGKPRQLKLVATLAHSIFQSEMLMSDANFRRLFPMQAGFGTVLAEVPADKVQALQQMLNNELDPYAVSVDTTAARLEQYQQIQNTYLSTFQALGALGLALGTIGLAVVLVRNVIERRPELALLAALGFGPGSRLRLVLSETVFLLVLGLFVGAACALLGVIPTIINSRGGVAWLPLGITLAAVLIVGFVSCVIAVWATGMRAAPADLRGE